uniref:Helicase n=1 Tax=Loa loa TaxID=7209 RepID=A0A1I7VJ52_LOALO
MVAMKEEERGAYVIFPINQQLQNLFAEFGRNKIMRRQIDPFYVYSKEYTACWSSSSWLDFANEDPGKALSTLVASTTDVGVSF